MALLPRCAGAILAALLPLFPAASVPPRRIMSVNLCTDLPLLMLVPRARIASITWLAHPLATALLPGADTGVAINHGVAEEVLTQAPDLILTSGGVAPVVRRLAAAQRIPIVDMAAADDFPGIRRSLRDVGAAVGEPARAAALLARMDRTLAQLAATRPARPTRVVAWSGGGTVPGKGTLTGAILAAAGAENVAARAGRAYASFGLEELATTRADAVLLPVGPYAQPSLHQGRARHPLLDRAFAGRQVDYPEAAYACGLPQAADAAVALRAALARLPAAPR